MVGKMESLKYLVLTLDELYEMTLDLSILIKNKLRNIEAIVAVSKGGVIIARLLADFLNIKYLYSIQVALYEAPGKVGRKPILVQSFTCRNKHTTALIVDDVSDTGITLSFAYDHVKSIIPTVYTATLFIKPWTKYVPDFYLKTTDKWIIFPHEYAEFVREAIKYFSQKNWPQEKILKWITSYCGFPEKILLRVMKVISLDIS
ncbi:MAG: hypothetical protein DRN04_09555 [Thermoprotei archaeon]|nr:MAG: hypothetical protein DRN04_09555 [Thermoprotei archaeon]